MLHLLTGFEPYEELLKDVHCPLFLAQQLRALWCTEDPDSQYHVVWEVVQSLDPDSYETDGAADPAFADFGAELILMDTLYRYVVLFGGLGAHGAHDSDAPQPMGPRLAAAGRPAGCVRRESCLGCGSQCSGAGRHAEAAWTECPGPGQRGVRAAIPARQAALVNPFRRPPRD